MAKVLYVGKDTKYFEDLKARLSKRAKSEGKDDFEYVQLWQEDLNTFQRISKQIVNELPHICFLDYSSHPLKMMTVARSLPRLFERGPKIFGLWDYQADPAYYRESQTLGIPFTHIKSREFSDIVDQIFYFMEGGDFPEGKFAQAEVMNRPLLVEGSSLFRVGYATENYLHVEHDFLIKKDETINLTSFFGSDFPINKYKCERRIDNDFYYEMAYCSDLSYVIEEKKPQNFTEKTLEKKNANYAAWLKREEEEKILKTQVKVSNYIKNHSPDGLSKRTRVLVIDEEMSILDQATKPLDMYRYSIRFYRKFSLREGLLLRILPGIICYQIPQAKEGSDVLNEMPLIIKAIKKMTNYAPFLVIFNSKKSSEALQKEYNYERIASWSETFQFDQLLKFCGTYQEKFGRDKTHDSSRSRAKNEERFYIKKDTSESFMKFKFPLYLKAVCETWLKFQTEEDLKLWSIIKIHEPVPFYFTVIERLEEKDWQKKGMIQYRGVVHGLGERERASLRREINTMIYKEIKYSEAMNSKPKDEAPPEGSDEN